MSPADENQALSQDDIDALVAARAATADPAPAPVTPEPAPASAPAAETAQPAPAPPPPPAAAPAPAPAATAPNSADLADLTRRIEKLEELATQVARIQQRLTGSPLEGLRQDFQCDDCGEKGHVTARISCTNCDSESWWGWWPDG